jgi:hypothetical protein
MKGMNAVRNYCCMIMLCALALETSAQSQSPASIHLQTENNQAFEVKWNGKNFESSASGFLVLPQVAAGNQSFIVVFSGELPAEYTFTIMMQNESKGYSLRQAIDNSWSLFDMIELATLKGVFNEPVAKVTIPSKPEIPIPMPVIADKPVEKIPVKFVETPALKTEPPVVVKPRSPMVTGILKIFDKSGNTGIDQVYVLTNGTRSDTIALFIPALGEEIPKTGTNPAASLPGKNEPIIILADNPPAVIRQRYPSISK